MGDGTNWKEEGGHRPKYTIREVIRAQMILIMMGQTVREKRDKTCGVKTKNLETNKELKHRSSNITL